MFLHTMYVNSRKHTQASFKTPAISPPTAVWEDISMNFIMNLPAYHSQLVIMVVIDRLSNVAHFGPYLPTLLHIRLLSSSHI